MTSDSHEALSEGSVEWQRAEQALDRLIAAHHNLMRDGGTVAAAPGPHHAAVPAAPDVDLAADPAAIAAVPTVLPVAQAALSRWPTVVLLSAVWISVALVVSAAILSVAKLL